jgi:hypothetical protein
MSPLLEIPLASDLVVKVGKLGTAIFSKDDLYRYRLTRRWAPGGLTIVWVMLNPSRADHERNDTTIAKCVGFSKKLSGTSLVVVNLFGLITTDPSKLLSMENPQGQHNYHFLRGAGIGADRLIVAWGAWSKRLATAMEPSIRVIRENYPTALCVGRTKTGAPHHPVRLPYETNFEPWIN